MTEIKNNLFGIKWPTGVDMPLNKTQTQNNVSFKIHFCLFSYSFLYVVILCVVMPSDLMLNDTFQEKICLTFHK